MPYGHRYDKENILISGCIIHTLKKLLGSQLFMYHYMQWHKPSHYLGVSVYSGKVCVLRGINW